MTGNDRASLTAQKKALAALEAVRAIRTIDEIARECGVDSTEVRQWEHELIQNGARLFSDTGEPTSLTGDDARAEKKLSFPSPKSITCVSQLTSEQTQIRQKQVNEALVLKIFECQRIEEALQQSECRLHQLLAHQEQIKEEERKRIAREIHDDLGQTLLALRIDISMLHARTHGHQRLHEKVSVTLDNIDVAIKSVRSIINDMRPFELELGLQAAVDWQLKRFERISGLVCQLSVDQTTSACSLSDEQTLAIFRILQESLSNIARHSHATKVEVTLAWNDRTFLMIIKDNGVGINSDDRRKAKSFGIVGIKERVSSLNGELVINSGSGQGTALSIIIPIENEE